MPLDRTIGPYRAGVKHRYGIVPKSSNGAGSTGHVPTTQSPQPAPPGQGGSVGGPPRRLPRHDRRRTGYDPECAIESLQTHLSAGGTSRCTRSAAALLKRFTSGQSRRSKRPSDLWERDAGPRIVGSNGPRRSRLRQELHPLRRRRTVPNPRVNGALATSSAIDRRGAAGSRRSSARTQRRGAELSRATSLGGRTMAECSCGPSPWAASSCTRLAPRRPTSWPGCAIVEIGMGLSHAAWLLS